MGRSPLLLVSSLAAVLAVAAPSLVRGELVILDSGRLVKAEGYEVDGDRVRIQLATGGELVMPLLRIDRVINDEVAVDTDSAPQPPDLAPDEPLYLGFAPDQIAPATPFGEVIFSISKSLNVNPDLVAAIVRAESAFDPGAVSRTGARGLMQLMPSTARRFGATAEELFDPEVNIEAGVIYLEQLIERYAEDLPVILAVYSAGEHAVERHGGVPPFRETHDYIRRIYSFLGLRVASSAASGK